MFVLVYVCFFLYKIVLFLDVDIFFFVLCISVMIYSTIKVRPACFNLF